MRRPDIRSTPGVEFALVCGGVHFLLATASTAPAVSAAYDLADVLFFIGGGYFAAFSLWLAIRAWLFVVHLGEQPARGAVSAGLHLPGGLVVTARRSRHHSVRVGCFRAALRRTETPNE